ncbi:MAG: hypothetical protein AVDCRST_MAG05-72, partial [uncultured Rubrobacteraceae bacterium]
GRDEPCTQAPNGGAEGGHLRVVAAGEGPHRGRHRDSEHRARIPVLHAAVVEAAPRLRMPG